MSFGEVRLYDAPLYTSALEPFNFVSNGAQTKACRLVQTLRLLIGMERKGSNFSFFFFVVCYGGYKISQNLMVTYSSVKNKAYIFH